MGEPADTQTHPDTVCYPYGDISRVREQEIRAPHVAPVSEPLTTALRVVVQPGKPGEPDPGIRLRQWLKLGLRAFGIRAEWAPTDPAENSGAERPTDQHTPEEGRA